MSRQDNINLDRQLFNSNTLNNTNNYKTNIPKQTNNLDSFFQLQSNTMLQNKKVDNSQMVNTNDIIGKKHSESVGFFDRNLLFNNRNTNVNYQLPVDTHIMYNKDKYQEKNKK